jgi:glycosyltransferase involved in cell wall biosynthesis
MNNKKFLYSLANDADADPTFPIMHTLRDRMLYKYGLLNADEIIAQTKKQKNSLKKGFDLDSSIMPMPCPGTSNSEYLPLEWSDGKPTILWAARIHESKRLELLLDIASDLPEYNFIVGGSPGNENDYFKGLLQRMDKLNNVKYLGMVARADMPSLYRSSTVFCCSSEYEGFPNTFLEAWSNGLPIVSTFDPDNLIKEKALGFPAKNVEDLISGIKALCSDKELWLKHSANSRDYYQCNHSVDQVMERFENIFVNLSN